MRFIPFFGLTVITAWVLLSGASHNNGVVITEASGVERLGDKLLVVGDDADGSYFEFSLPEKICAIIPLDPQKVIEVPLPGAELAMDLESLAQLADGRLAFLSEQLRCLIAQDTPGSDHYVVIAEYDRTLAEFGGRGLEGLAVKKLSNGDSRIAVLWEGGYVETGEVPAQLHDVVCKLPLKPVVLIHEIKHGQKAGRVMNPLARITLDVPVLEGEPPLAQRYRAVDLVWHTGDGADGEELIVLLSSSNAPPEKDKHLLRYKSKILQRFDLAGNRVGSAIDLKDICCEALDHLSDAEFDNMGDRMCAHVKEITALLTKHDWENVNWEGLGWFVEGEKMITIYDKVPKDPPVALIIDLPQSWK